MAHGTRYVEHGFGRPFFERELALRPRSGVCRLVEGLSSSESLYQRPQ